MSHGIIIRPATGSDRGVRFRIYAEDRADELALSGWPEEQREQFLRMQFDMRERAYSMQFPGLETQMIESEDAPVGQLLTEERDDELLLVDIALLTCAQSQGIGKLALRQLIERAARSGKKITLRVDKTNARARRFYERNGFKPTDENQLQVQMEYRA